MLPGEKDVVRKALAHKKRVRGLPAIPHRPFLSLSYLSGQYHYLMEVVVNQKIYVGNLPYSTTDQELQDLFANHGNVQSASVVTDRYTGRSRGFGFVEMESAEEAQQAISALNGTDYGGRNLVVNEARPKESRPPGGR